MGIVKIVGLIIFLYLTWRNLKDDYEGDLLISYSWLAVLSFFVGGRIVYGLANWGVWNVNIADWWQFWLHSGFSYYGGIGSMWLMTWYFCNHNGWKMWSLFEDMTPAYYLMMSFFLAEEFAKSTFALSKALVIGVMVVGYLLANFVTNKYRSYVWYKSGRKGFVFLFVNLIVAILLTIISLVFLNGWFNVILNIVIIFFFLAELLILGEVFKK